LRDQLSVREDCINIQFPQVVCQDHVGELPGRDSPDVVLAQVRRGVYRGPLYRCYRVVAGRDYGPHYVVEMSALKEDVWHYVIRAEDYTPLVWHLQQRSRKGRGVPRRVGGEPRHQFKIPDLDVVHVGPQYCDGGFGDEVFVARFYPGRDVRIELLPGKEDAVPVESDAVFPSHLDYVHHPV